MIFKNNSFRKYFYVLVLPALVFSGCGVWENFTTYFNLYYNTAEAFEQAEKAIYEQERDLFSTEDLNVPGSSNQLILKVIEKASKILQFHPNSSFVDESLLMLGKSFYYQRNYLKAIRKFQELVATQPESGLILETRLWIGKSHMRLKEYEKGLPLLRAVSDSAKFEGEDEIVRDAFIEEIKYFIANEDYPEAINTLNEFVPAAADDQMRAEIYYQLGKLYYELEELENAIASYREVENYSPVYKTELNAKVELAKTLREAGRSDAALEVLEDMAAQNKYSESFHNINLESGITLADLERYDEALNMLTYVDTAYKSSVSSSIAKYEIAKLYEYHFMNFDSAAAYYAKSVSGNAPPEIVIASNNKNQKFKKYQSLQASIAETDQKLAYLQDSSLYVQDSIDYYAELNANREAEDPTLANSENTAFNNNENNFNSANSRDTTTAVNDTLNNPVNRENAPVNESLPRNRAVDNRIRNQLAGAQTQTQKKPPVWPTLPKDSLNSILIKNKLDLANLFFTEFDLPDSAFYYYTDIVTNYPDSQYQGRVLFGLGSYYEAVNEQQKADSIYNIIYDEYKTESIVNAAAAKLKKPLIDLEYDPAKELYAEAEKVMLDQNYRESLNKFYDIYINHPESALAPKALYAGGWILENEFKMYDSAAVFYDSLAVQYPKSEYASAVRPKLQTYKIYKKHIADSLKAIKLAADSLRADSIRTFFLKQNPALAADSLMLDSLVADSMAAFNVMSNTITTSDTLITDSTGTKIPEPVQTPIEPDRRVRDNERRRAPKTEADSLKQRSDIIIDSLRRRPDAPPNPVQQETENLLDSIPPPAKPVEGDREP